MKTSEKIRLSGCTLLAAVLCFAPSAYGASPAAGCTPAATDPTAAVTPAVADVRSASTDPTSVNPSVNPSADPTPAVPTLAVCPTAPGCAGESPKARLARLDGEIADRARALNYLVWEQYLGQMERKRLTPDVLGYPGLDFRAVRDTVSAIARAEAAYRQADSLYTRVLETHPDYRDIHREYVALKGVSDREMQNRNKQRYNLMYSDLRNDNPDYPPARDRRLEALRVRNMALVRFLLEYYRAQGREMPTEPLIPRSTVVSGKCSMELMRRECTAIGRQEEELRTLRKLRAELFELIGRQRYGVPHAR